MVCLAENTGYFGNKLSNPDPRPIASVSLDVDNLWSYLRTHGDSGWLSFPSYLPSFIPRVLGVLRERDLAVTAFVVGQDAALDVNREPLRALAEAGHEIGNHSFHHEPWLHLYTEEQLDAELARAEEAILEATGRPAARIPRAGIQSVPIDPGGSGPPRIRLRRDDVALRSWGRWPGRTTCGQRDSARRRGESEGCCSGASATVCGRSGRTAGSSPRGA